MGTLRVEIRRSFPPASARIWNSLSTAAVRPGDDLLWDWKSLSKRMQRVCLPQARRSVPVLSSYAIAGHFHNGIALEAAQAKLGAWGLPGSGAVGWRPGILQSAVGL